MEACDDIVFILDLIARVEKISASSKNGQKVVTELVKNVNTLDNIMANAI